MIGVGTLKLSPKSREYINDVLDSGRLSYGPYLQKFEKVFAAAHGCSYGVMSNSGTSSLLVALAALKEKYQWSDGDEVIVPSVTFIATSNIVLQNNMKPVFVDVDPVYYELDSNKIEQAITKKTRCIIPVHLFGCPCDMDPITEIAEKYNLKLIEDSCESMFVSYKGRPVGSLSDIGCFSTYVAHILTTGVGGLSITNQPDLAITLRSMVNHGRDSIYLSIDDDKDKTKEEMNLIIQRRFSFVRNGYSFRVTEFEGALGLAEFENHEAMMKERWENGQYLLKHLKKYEDRIQLPSIRPECGHSFMMFPIVLRHETKKEMVEYLEENGIETRDMLPLINQPYYKNLLGIKESDFPVGQWVNQSGFYMASHHGLTDVEKEYMVNVFDKFFKAQKVRKESFCLAVVSKRLDPPHLLALQNFVEKLDEFSFDELCFVDQVGHKDVQHFFKEHNFKILEVTKSAPLISRITEKVLSENIITIGLEGYESYESMNDIMIKLKGGQEIVIASRFLPQGRRMAQNLLSYRSLGNRFFTFLINIIFNRNVTDSNNFFRGFKKSTIERLNLKQNFDNAMFEMTVRALETDVSFDEIPTIEKDVKVKTNKRNSFVNAFFFFFILLRHFLQFNTKPKTKGLPS